MPIKAELFIFFGLIASGKSTLGQEWAKGHDMAYYNSDVVRKNLAGLQATEGRTDSLNQGIYSKEFSRKTYDALLELAEKDLRNGRAVVLDASYQNAEERARVRALAKSLDVQVYYIHCICPEAETKKRLAIRAQDPHAVSDGRWEIYVRQKERFTPPDELGKDELITLSTDATVDLLLEKLARELPWVKADG